MRVHAVVLNYNAAPDALRACVSSLLADPVVTQVLVADNASTQHADAAASVVEALRAEEAPGRVRHVAFGRNHGFAGGINRALAALGPAEPDDLVFLLNNDAVAEAGCVGECVRVLSLQSGSCVAVAPKMLLADDPTLIDAVGNAVNGRGEAFNVGLGQLDLGQYDTSRECFGACFGAALVRRAAFGEAMVGPLAEAYFLYYEDVDWNWRAQVLGYTCVTAPAARVRHVLSASTRTRPYGFKFRLAERNLLLTVARNAPPRVAAGIWVRRLPAYLRGALNGHYRVPSLHVFAGALVRGPGAFRAGRRLHARRRRAHDEIVAFAKDERTWFDAVRYVPLRTRSALDDVLRRAGRADLAAAVAAGRPTGDPRVDAYIAAITAP